MTAQKLLELARAETGTKENPANSNNVKYNTAYYGREVSGSNYAWCAVFIWWLFQQAGAPELYYGGSKTAYCPTLLAYHKGRGQAVTDYQPGDIIFFNFSGKTTAAHVGLCEAWDGQYITTIDGNTGEGNEANGGAVMRRKRAKKYIVGAYRPDYAEGEIDLTEEQVRAVVRDEYAKIEAEKAALPASDWAVKLLDEAKSKGITDATRPQSYATRQEVALMVNAAIK